MPKIKLDVSEDVERRLESLREKAGAKSRAELLTWALATYEKLFELSKGETIIPVQRATDGAKVTLILTPTGTKPNG